MDQKGCYLINQLNSVKTIIQIALALHVTFLLTNICSFGAGGGLYRFSSSLVGSCSAICELLLPAHHSIESFHSFALILKIFQCRIICFLKKSYLPFQKLRYLKEKITLIFLFYHSKFILPILTMKVFTLLHVISKRFELQRPDWTQLEDFSM